MKNSAYAEDKDDCRKGETCNRCLREKWSLKWCLRVCVLHTHYMNLNKWHGE